MNLHKYEEYILNKLLDKYEKSKLSKGNVKRDIKIRLNFDDKEFYDYVSTTGYKNKEIIDKICDKLVSKEFINLVFDGDYISKAILITDNVESIYEYLNRQNPKVYKDELITLLKSFKGNDVLVDRYIDYMIDSLINHKSIKYLNINNKEDVLDILKGLIAIRDNKTEITKRKLSIKIYNNSKRLEELESKIVKILADFENVDSQDLLLEHNIISNPSFIYLKGTGIFKINDQVIDLNKLKNAFAITTENLENIEILDLQVNEIVTIENLTTFYEYPANNELIIYLGGFHNSIRRKFLIDIYNYNKNIPFYHFGDVDAGGLYIYNHLREKTKIDFKTRYMNIDILKKYQIYSSKLTSNDKKRLTYLLDILPEKKNLIEYMLKHSIKLEQEVVEIK